MDLFLTNQDRAEDVGCRAVQALLPQQVGVTDSALAGGAVSPGSAPGWGVRLGRLCGRVAAPPAPGGLTPVEPLPGQTPQVVPVGADASGSALSGRAGGTGREQPDSLGVTEL